jgi:hypothetical protein
MPDEHPSFTALPFDDRLRLLDLLREMAVHPEAAEALEDRADRSLDPIMVTVLRGRAAERRELAEQLRADLVLHGVVPFRRRSRPL